VAAPTVPLSLPRANPSLQDVLAAWKNDVMSSTNCHGVATIQSLRTVPVAGGSIRVVTATMNYSRTYYEKVSEGNYQLKTFEYPMMIDCPMITIGGDTAALNMPVSPGDQCLILFNDRDLDNWFAGARTGPVASSRIHSFADAMALVGFNPLGFNFDPDRAILTDGNAKVGFNASTNLLTLQNNLVSLKTTLTDIATALSLLNAATPGNPATAQIALVNVDIAQLLE